MTLIEENLSIVNNDSLTSLAGFENLSFLGDDLIITNNRMLSFCSYEIICNTTSNGIALTDISDNTSGCDNEEGILMDCNYLSRISHPIFYDLDTNGIFDPGEPFFPASLMIASFSFLINFFVPFSVILLT